MICCYSERRPDAILATQILKYKYPETKTSNLIYNVNNYDSGIEFYIGVIPYKKNLEVKVDKKCYIFLNSIKKPYTIKNSNINIFHNSNKSLCQMVWNFLFPDIEIPWIVSYISDTETHKYEIKNSREISIALMDNNFISVNTKLEEIIDLNSFYIDKVLLPYGQNILKHNEYLINREIHVTSENYFYFQDYVFKVFILDTNFELEYDIAMKLCDKKMRDESLPDFVIISKYSIASRKIKLTIYSKKPSRIIRENFDGNDHIGFLTYRRVSDFNRNFKKII